MCAYTRHEEKAKIRRRMGSDEHVWCKRNLHVQDVDTHKSVLVETCSIPQSCVCGHRHWHTNKQKITPTTRQSGPLSTRPVLREALTATEGEKPSVWELHAALPALTRHSPGVCSHPPTHRDFCLRGQISRGGKNNTAKGGESGGRDRQI